MSYENYEQSYFINVSKINQDNLPDSRTLQDKLQRVIKEYVDLIDFPLLFKFISKYLLISINNFSSNISRLYTFVSNLKPIQKPTIEFSKLKPIYFGIASFCLVVSLVNAIAITAPLVSVHITSFKSKFTIAKSEKTGFINIKQKNRDVFLAAEATPEPLPKSNEFILSVPKIGLTSEVSPNVNLADENVYRQKLKENGVAHALGSYLPGQNGPSYLFAHSTDTIANIALLNAKFFALKDLNIGDEILIDYQGKKYNYLVKNKSIVKSTDLELIQESTSNLILQTCWPPGTDWQRLLIFADLKKDSPKLGQI